MKNNKIDVLLQVSISKNNIWTVLSKTWVNEFLYDFEIDDKEFIKALKSTQNTYSNQLVLFGVSLNISSYRGFEGDYDTNCKINIDFEELLFNEYEEHCIHLFYNQLSYIQNTQELEGLLEEFDIKFEPKEFISIEEVLKAKEENSLIDLDFFSDLKKYLNKKQSFNLI